uniref:Riboflavin biosynthesis protein n=1 Tax=Candidatus Aschnera chinzeii TaxID=1485666 RepID=A0AAT9G5B1_9ENTR|nr:MAG: bifunctional riboflavin kinase/FAD synthetase [Candidatus Aschnera chinzeii]
MIIQIIYVKLIRGIHNIQTHHHGCALTIGNFDGMHRGHQYLLSNLNKISKKDKIPMMVMIFEPQPLEFLSNSKSPMRLSALRDKINFFIQYNIDYLLCIKYNYQFASLSAYDFIKKLLVHKLNIKYLVIGSDFRFGNNREGNHKLLYQASKKYNFKVINIINICHRKRKISSTTIRTAISMNNFKYAENLLGHQYCLTGKVIEGNKIGNLLGFPTANILYKQSNIPIKGVYIVLVYGIINNSALKAVANIGVCPTINGTKQKIEVHLIDICINIYRYYIKIIFCKKLRNEKKFSSIKKLKKQIKKDICNAKHYFTNKYNLLKINRESTCIIIKIP